MMDMGFIDDLKTIIRYLPANRQTIMFSATMPSDIASLAHKLLSNPLKVAVNPPATTVERIKQTVMFVDKKEKMNLLVHVIKEGKYNNVLVFVGMKHLANKVVDRLMDSRISAAAIHGNKSQGARQRALGEFSDDKVRVLVATDIASRGIDVDGISHVINFDLPNVPEDYVHRIGRTARAGMEGDAVSFCTDEEKAYLIAIEKTIRQKIEIVMDQPYHSDHALHSKGLTTPPRGGGGRRGGGGGGRSGGGGGGGNRKRGGGGGSSSGGSRRPSSGRRGPR